MNKLILFILPILFISLVFAQNQTCINGTCEVYPSIPKYTINQSISIQIPNCSEQLQILLNEYNNLTEDYKSGANCGTLRDLLVDNNAKLSNSLKECNKEIGRNEIYKGGFYFLFITLIVVIVYWFYEMIRINHRRKK